MVVAGFERDVQGRPSRSRPGALQRFDLGVWRTSARMIPLAYHLAVAHQDCADLRVGAGVPTSGEPPRATHVALVCLVGCAHRSAAALVHERAQLVHELFCVLELTVDAGEAHVGDGIGVP